MYPKFKRAIKTAPLTMEDAKILEGSVSVNGVKLTAEEILADPSTRRITETRDIMTGEWGSETHAKTHDNKPLPYYVFSVPKE